MSPGKLAWRRFRHHRMAVAGALIMLALILYVIGGTFVWSETFANQTATAKRLAPPSLEHPFGTDQVGRDVLARTIYDGHISLLIGVSAMLMSLTFGVTVGALAGYYGGLVDSLLMRLTEAMFSIPSLFLLIVMSKFFGGRIPPFDFFGRSLSGSMVVIIVVIRLTSWMCLVRLVRANFLSLKEREFILAAQCLGVPNRRAS